jgi:hypothetical protein
MNANCWPHLRLQYFNNLEALTHFAFEFSHTRWCAGVQQAHVHRSGAGELRGNHAHQSPDTGLHGASTSDEADPSLLHLENRFHVE